MILRRATGILSSLVVTLAASLLLSATALAQKVIHDEVRTVSNGTAPYERVVNISSAGTYRVVLTDQNASVTNADAARQPMVSVKAAVTKGTTVLGTTTMATGTASGHIDFTLAAGADIVIRIVGKQATGKSGSVGIELRSGDQFGTVVSQFAAAFSPPAAEIPSYRSFNVESFTPESTGTYSVELEDFHLPSALTELKAQITSSSSILANLNATAGQSTATFAVNSLEFPLVVTVFGDASQAVNAGLMAVRIRNTATGAIAFSRIYPLGEVAQIGSVELEAGAHTLTFSDLQFPAALTRAGIVLAANGTADVKTNASGAVDFTATKGTHQVFALATAAAGNTGSYGVDVSVQGGGSKFSIVNAPGGVPANGVYAYNFIADIKTAGSYRLRLADFNFPGTLAAVNLIAAQGGVKLDGLAGPGTLTLPNVAMGPLFVVVVAKPAIAGGGLIGLDVTPAAGGTPALEESRGIGNLSESRQVTAEVTGNYRVNVTDLKFPAAFTQFSAIVTRGADTNVAVFGSDQFDFPGKPGKYQVNFIAQPNATEGAGTYGLKVTQLPAAPVITLTANPSEPPVGTTVRIEWSVANAKSCTASGAWSGAKATSGGENSGAITATSTFTLKCEGDGGSSTQSVSVSPVNQSNSGGGGGALGWLTLAGLALAGGARLGRRRGHI